MVGAVAPSTDIFVVAHEWAAFKAPARVGHGSSQWTASTSRWWAAAGLTLPRQRLIGKSALRAGMGVTVLGVLAPTGDHVLLTAFSNMPLKDTLRNALKISREYHCNAASIFLKRRLSTS